MADLLSMEICDDRLDLDLLGMERTLVKKKKIAHVEGGRLLKLKHKKVNPTPRQKRQHLQPR